MKFSGQYGVFDSPIFQQYFNFLFWDMEASKFSVIKNSHISKKI